MTIGGDYFILLLNIILVPFGGSFIALLSPVLEIEETFALDACYGVPESGIHANCSESVLLETEGMGDKYSLSLFGGNHGL